MFRREKNQGKLGKICGHPSVDDPLLINNTKMDINDNIN